MKKCLIIVDYQVDFVTGSLGFEKAKALDGKIAEKIKQYRKSGYEIIFTLDTHTEDYLNTLEGRNLPAAHCIAGTEGHKLYGETALQKQDCDRCFYKPSFGSAELFDYLRGGEYESVELCGVVSNICVLSNAVLAKTALPETSVIVDSNCVASNEEKLNRAAIEVMKSMHIRVTE